MRYLARAGQNQGAIYTIRPRRGGGHPRQLFGKKPRLCVTSWRSLVPEAVDYKGTRAVHRAIPHAKRRPRAYPGRGQGGCGRPGRKNQWRRAWPRPRAGGRQGCQGHDAAHSRCRRRSTGWVRRTPDGGAGRPERSKAKGSASRGAAYAGRRGGRGTVYAQDVCGFMRCACRTAGQGGPSGTAATGPGIGRFLAGRAVRAGRVG